MLINVKHVGFVNIFEFPFLQSFKYA